MVRVGGGLRYLSVCSGIEAASVWSDLGWECAGVAEIEPFPCQVLAQRLGAGRPRYMPDPNAEGLSKKDAKARASAIKAMDGKHMRWGNQLTNFGDFTQIREDDVGPIDLLVGGTPCQSFSIAGKRLGLDDPRGNLTLEFLALAKRLRARWICWENVPGVLSHDEGRTFGTFLGLLGECGFERWAYRVLDAQYVRVGKFPWAVPQRRRRVFVIGYSGAAAIHPRAVLFDRESLRGDPAPRRETGQGVAPTLAARTNGGGGLGTDFDRDGGLVAHALRGEGFDASEDGTGRGTPIVPVQVAGTICRDSFTDGAGGRPEGAAAGHFQPVAFDCKGTEVQFSTDGSHPTLRSMGHSQSHQNAGGHAAIAYAIQERAVSENPDAGPDGKGVQEGVAYTLEARTQVQATASRWGVRRLTPRECERLQGFPDDWTAIEWRGKPAEQCPDGPRYKACGNSMARNVMLWLGERIDAAEKASTHHARAAA